MSMKISIDLVPVSVLAFDVCLTSLYPILLSILCLHLTNSFEQESGPYRPYSARTSTDLSIKQSQSTRQNYYSPPKSAPIPSHEQFGYHLGHGINNFANGLGYRNAIERGGFVPELRSG